MCGVATLLSFNTSTLDVKKLRAMTDVISYRGPDDHGFALWSDEAPTDNKTVSFPKLNTNFAIGMGHRRLSILDLSPAGHQPMTDVSGRYWLTYNGEIYNYRELQSELKSRGHHFRSQTDSEVILASFKEWGPDCVKHFNGMWSFVLLDTKEQKLFASRDRFGVKPLYFARSTNSFGLASEIKQLRAAGFGTGDAQRENVTQFLLYGDVNATNETMFKGIFQVLPGHFLIWDLQEGLGSERIVQHYALPACEPSDHGKNFADYAMEFRELLRDSVRLRLRSDVEVGSCLSGGMDSSAIVLSMREQLGTNAANLQTFTSCFQDPKYDEWDFAKLVAERANARAHQVFPEMDSLWRELPDLLWHQEEPFGSTSIYAQWNVMRKAQGENIKVLLDGQGADEVMWGYHSYLPLHLSTLVRHGQIATAAHDISALRETGLLGVSQPTAKTLTKAAASLLQVRRLSRSPLSTVLNPELKQTRKSGWTVDMGQVQTQDLYGSMQALLRYEDRNSMAFSVEARTPFLDYRLVEFFRRLPMKYRFEGGWSKPLLRASMEGRMPEEVRLRVDKKGFVTPEATWFSKNRQKISETLLKDANLLTPWLQPDTLASLARDFTTDSSTLWRILCTQMWMKRFDLK